MPEIEEIEKFKEIVNSLGNEPSILAEKGEKIEDVPVPEEGLSDDISQLLDGFSGEEPSDSQEISAEVIPGEALDDDDFLISSKEDRSEKVSGLEEPATDDFSLPDTLDMDLPAEGGEAFPEGDAASEASAPEEPDVSDFSLPETLDMDLPAEGGEAFSEGDAVSEAPAPEGAADANTAEGGGMDISSPMDEPQDESFEFDEFDLGDISQHFGISESEPSSSDFSEELLNPASSISSITDKGKSSDIKISDRDFRNIQNTLSSLPLRLKIIIEDLIGGSELTSENLKTLVSMLVKKSSPRDLAVFVGNVTGKKIPISGKYAKKTGLQFESERKSFIYTFKKNALPIFGTFFVCAMVMLLGYEYIVVPLRANSLYEKGRRAISEDKFLVGNDYFKEAVKIKSNKNEFYKYAAAFREKKEDDFAEEKYEQLLKRYPGDKKGIIDYAVWESKYRSNFVKAEKLLKGDRNIPQYGILDKKVYDFEAMLALGDNYLSWALDEEWNNKNPEDKFENARSTFASMLEEYRTKKKRDIIFFRMMKFFINTDNMEEVLRLKEYFEKDKKVKINPEVYAKLGGYLISKDQYEGVKDILTDACEENPYLPETHYNLSRYFRYTNEPEEEEKALSNSLLFSKKAPETREQQAILIDTYKRQGELFYKTDREVQAEDSFQNAIRQYERALERKFVKKDEIYGEIYADLADVYYYNTRSLSEYTRALLLYNKAYENLYSTSDVKYKQGFIYYANQDYENALLKFINAAGDFSVNKNLLYATANTFLKRRDYYAAEGYYNNLLNQLTLEKSRIKDIVPEERKDHYAVILSLMKVFNNLGVTLNHLSKQSRRFDERYARSLVYLTKSAEYFDILKRDPITMERNRRLPYHAAINTRTILDPKVAVKELISYSYIPKDMEQNLWSEE